MCVYFLLPDFVSLFFVIFCVYFCFVFSNIAIACLCKLGGKVLTSKCFKYLLALTELCDIA